MVKLHILEALQVTVLKDPKESLLQPHVTVRLITEDEGEGGQWSTEPCTGNTVPLNGLHPIWNKNMEPLVLRNRDLAFLDFTLSEVPITNKHE